MNKLRMAFFALVGVMMTATTALAQEPFRTSAEAAANDPKVLSYARLAAGFGFAIAAALAAIGQSRVAAAAAEGVARNPGAGARIQTLMILGLVFIETLVLFTLVIVFAKL